MDAQRPGSKSYSVLPALAVMLFVIWTVFSLVEPKKTISMRLNYDYGSRAELTSLRTLYEERWIEYPPLAIGLMLVTRHTANALAPLWELFTTAETSSDNKDFFHFGRTFGLLSCAIQILVFLGLYRLCRRLYPDESPRDLGERLLGYLVGSLLMTTLVHQRFDAMLAALVFLSLWLLQSGRWVMSFVVLAAGVNFKLVPMALIPLWLFSSLSCGMLAEAGSARGLFKLVAALTGRCALMAGFVIAWLLPFYAVCGPRCLAFLAYHQERGIHCESCYGTLVMMLRLLGHPVEPRFLFGSFELHSPLTPILGTVSTVLLAAGLLTACLLAFVALRRVATIPGQSAAAIDGGLIAALAVLTLMIFAGLGKVFSPQFVLWVMPLVPLLPLTERDRRWFFGLFLGASLLTRLAFPLFVRYGLDDSSALLPTAILAARTVLWLGLSGWLALCIGRGRLGQKQSAVPATIFPKAA